MKINNNLLLGLICLFAAVSLSAQDRTYTVMFYNVENLFDVYNDPNVRDDEFTPEGPKEWTETKYWKKIANTAEVLHAIAQANRQFPAIIGLSEIENRLVLDDLVSDERLASANYQIVHYDSPEARGVDVALLYRPDLFEYEWSDPIRTRIPGRPDFKTRDILAVCGRIEGELFCFFVNHWSSRRGGAQSSEYLRCGGAQTVRDYADSLRQVHPEIKLVVMGDMNDDPVDKSILEVLGGAGDPENIPEGGMFNPFYALFQDGYGTLAYQDAWSLYDNIVVSDNLMNLDQEGSLRLMPVKLRRQTYYASIFKRSFLIQQKGQYKNYPWRTYSGNAFLGGYSDHLPVFITIGKEK